MRRMLLSSLMLAIVATCAFGQATQPAESGIADRVWAHYSIGHSSTDNATRRIGWGPLKQGDWSKWINQQIEPVVDRGVRRIMLHNPFGVLSGEPMQFDQAVEAKAGVTRSNGQIVHKPMPALVDNFAPAWRQFLDSHPDVTLLVYLGSLNEKSFGARRSEPKAWCDRFQKSIDPLPLDSPQVELAIDRLSVLPADHPGHQAARWLQSLGVRVYAEPRPRGEHATAFDVVAIDRIWKRTDPGKYEDARRKGFAATPVEAEAQGTYGSGDGPNASRGPIDGRIRGRIIRLKHSGG